MAKEPAMGVLVPIIVICICVLVLVVIGWLIVKEFLYPSMLPKPRKIQPPKTPEQIEEDKRFWEEMDREEELEEMRQQAMFNRSEEHTSELQSRRDLVCRLLLEKKKQ